MHEQNQGTEYPEIRQRLEAQGYAVTDKLYNSLLAYARRKAQHAGKGESYIPYLLPDVIREHFFRLSINTRTAAMERCL